jgi:hypothetical protein
VPVIVGLQSRYKDDDAAAALAIAGTDVAPLGTSTDTGTAIRNTDLVPTEQAIASFVGTHKGSFRVWVRLLRPTSNTGLVTVALEWGEGGYSRPTRNDLVAKSFAAGTHEGRWLLCDLGTCHVSPEADTWEFRVLASSTAVGDEIDVGQVLLFPAGAPGEKDRYGEASGVVRFETPSQFLARDEFDQSSGALNGKALPVGGNWATSGSDSDDFQVNATARTVQRTSLSDTVSGIDVGRVAIAGSTNHAAAIVQADLRVSGISTEAPALGLIHRRTDADNQVRVDWYPNDGLANTLLQMQRWVGGAEADLAPTIELPPAVADTPYTLRLLVDAAGRWFVWHFRRGSAPGAPVALGQDDVLATGGTLASGKAGIRDVMVYPAPATTRSFDNFFVAPTVPDAAIFAGQTLEWTHNQVRREPQGGGNLQRVSRFRGKYLTLPPAGPEGRDSRIIIRGVVGPELQEGVLLDDDLANVTATLYGAPRGLVVP